MKVRTVEAIPVSYREPTDHNRFRSVCLVKITDTDGRVGWGEACTFFPEASRAAAKIIEGLADLVIGQSAQHVETIWHSLKQHTWWYGTGAGIVSFAISGIDIALWDLKGKQLGASVLDLLGGPVRDRLPAIASLHGTKSSIEEMAEEIGEHTATGLHGAKVGFGKAGDANLGFDEARDLEFVEKVQAAMGPGKDLMIDLGVKNFWDVPTAIRRARAFEERGVAWLEEPLGHDDPEGYAALRAGSGHSHRLRRTRMERPRRATDRRDRNRGRDRARPRPGRRHYRLPQGRRYLRPEPPPSQRPQLLHGDRRGGEPGPELRLPRLLPAGAAARLRSRATRSRRPPDLAQGWLREHARRTGAWH